MKVKLTESSRATETEPLGITRITQPSDDGFIAELTCKFRFKTTDPRAVFKVLDQVESLIKKEVENNGIDSNAG